MTVYYLCTNDHWSILRFFQCYFYIYAIMLIQNLYSDIAIWYTSTKKYIKSTILYNKLYKNKYSINQIYNSYKFNFIYNPFFIKLCHFMLYVIVLYNARGIFFIRTFTIWIFNLCLCHLIDASVISPDYKTKKRWTQYGVSE